jgi:hypothetical protein
MSELYCYRYHAWDPLDYDEEIIWADVTYWGGRITVRNDSVDFWIPASHQLLFVLKYPELTRQQQLDF